MIPSTWNKVTKHADFGEVSCTAELNKSSIFQNHEGMVCSFRSTDNCGDCQSNPYSASLSDLCEHSGEDCCFRQAVPTVNRCEITTMTTNFGMVEVVMDPTTETVSLSSPLLMETPTRVYIMNSKSQAKSTSGRALKGPDEAVCCVFTYVPSMGTTNNYQIH
mmetsp:Transcript_54739/g.61985  ORF Transcript_54739/g.61985 Transcript_54739/m.61985 type:complete len:162 (-) Transcript_54739:587-1072(-)